MAGTENVLNSSRVPSPSSNLGKSGNEPAAPDTKQHHEHIYPGHDQPSKVFLPLGATMLPSCQGPRRHYGFNTSNSFYSGLHWLLGVAQESKKRHKLKGMMRGMPLIDNNLRTFDLSEQGGRESSCAHSDNVTTGASSKKVTHDCVIPSVLRR
jgi:hypothetical protein